MTNDIRRNIMLIESLILDESFKDAQVKFSTIANPDEVKSYIDKFKELSKKNIIKGQDKDIGKWIKGDWDSFKKFVDSNKEVTTKRQTKTTQKKDSIVVYKDEKKQVVIPLTKEASIHYGKNTKWCTAASESENYFIDYFYARKITLFYVLFKDGNKYACAFHPDRPNTIECFDQQDKSMYLEQFEEATGVSKKDIQSWYNSNKTKIEDSRDLNKCSEEVQLAVVSQSGLAIEYIANPSEKVQLVAVNKFGLAIKYISNPSEKVQLAAVKKSGSVIRYIDNPSEEVQLAAVSQDGRAIQDIDNPSEEVQLVAVNKFGLAIKYISNPSEKVQLAVISQVPYVLQYINNPTEKTQLLAVERGASIQYIDNPSEEVQLTAVNKYVFAIWDIDNPSEKVQLAAVNKDGLAIEYIYKKGIVPSEKVQLAAVSQDSSAIRYISNPTEKVQLAAVSQDSSAISYIDYPTEKVKALHNKLWEK